MKQSRTMVVLAVAVVTAGLAAFAVYTAIQNMPVREVEVGSVPVVVASKTVAVGTRLTTDDLRVVAWPARSPVEGAFADPQEVVDRGVIETIGQNEPITLRKVASREAGAGLPPVIPEGMRALSVRVNEVVGVAGFVLPGTRVDVLVSVNNSGERNNTAEPMARTVVSNVMVLTSGTRYDIEAARNGQPERATVVTLAVLPEDGERIALAAAQGQISLTLRNPMDVEATKTDGIKLAALMRGEAPPPPVIDPVQRRVVRPAPRPEAAALTPPPAPSIYKVETIRAAKRAEEVVN